MNCCCKCLDDETNGEKLDLANGKYLFAFDFDNTIINDNSDTAITNVIAHPIPPEVRGLYDGTNWTFYMEKIFKYIHDQGASVEDIRQRVCSLPLAPGMGSLLKRLKGVCEKGSSKLIIVSDANDFFIESYLSNLNPPIRPHTIITNKSEVSPEGFLKITPFQDQTTCPLCPRNLCKGSALENYLAKEGPFDKIFYTGDGANDLCPIQHLRHNDTGFVRKGYSLEKMIQRGTTFKGDSINILAQVIIYEDAKTIENEIFAKSK